MTMRDYDNAVAVWNEFNELPPGIEAFRQFVVSNTEGPLVVVGDNRGLLSAGLGVDRDVIMMRHRDELRASDVDVQCNAQGLLPWSGSGQDVRSRQPYGQG